MEFTSNSNDSEVDLTVPYYKDYHFQVLKNAIMFEGTQAAATGDTEFVHDLVLRVKNFEEQFNLQSHLLDIRNEHGYNMLHFFVVNNDWSMVKLLLDNNADCDCTTNDNGQYTPLHLCIIYYTASLDSLDVSHISPAQFFQSPSHLQIIELLLQRGANVNHQDAEGNTPLILACKYNHCDLVKMLAELIEVKIDLANHNGDTALHVACAGHLTPAVMTLLTFSASVECKNKIGQTPAFTACMAGDEQILRLLLYCEADVKQNLMDDYDKDGNSLLMVAVQSINCTKQLVEFLLSLKSNLRTSNCQGNNVLHLFQSKCNPEIIDLIIDQDQSLLLKNNCNKEQPLHIAAKHGNKDSAFVFIERGASLEARDNNDMTPFMVSILYKHREVIELFIECGCDIYSNGKFGKTILDWAIEKESTDLLKALTGLYGIYQPLCLVDRNENNLVHATAKFHIADCLSVVLSTSYGEKFTSSYNKFGFTPLHCAVECGNINCVQKLIQNGALTIAEDYHHNTPLHIACQKGHLKIIKFLMEQTGVDWEANNKVFGTPLSCAAANGHSDVVKYLLSKDISIDGGYEHCALQSTPLMLACKNGHANTAKVLLNNDNINVDISNSNGYNCLIEAILNGHRAVTMTLITSSHWQNLMRFCAEDNETPMRLLIKHMPDIAEVVLDQCITEKLNCVDDAKACNVDMITYIFEFLDDFQDMPHTKFYHRILNIFFKPTTAIEASFEDTDAPEELDENLAWGPIMYNKSSHPLMLMVTHQRTRLLTHPVVRSLLHYKWMTFGAPSFLVNLIFYVVFLAFFIALVVLTPLPNGSVCRVDGCWGQWGSWSCCTEVCGENVSTQSRTRYCNDPPPMLGGKLCDGKIADVQTATCNNTSLCSETLNNTNSTIDTDVLQAVCTSVPLKKRSRTIDECEKDGLRKEDYTVLITANYILLTSSVIQLLRELVQLWRRRILYFYDLENFVELSMCVLTIMFCAGHHSDDCLCTNAAVWQIGAVALFLAWMDLLMFLKRLPFTGIPINILLNIVYTFLTLAIVPVLLILSFAYPFYMLLVRPDELTPFSSPARAFLKTLVMTTGEFEFDTIFLNSHDDNSSIVPRLYFPAASYFLWIVFIILMPVLFNNLLVGLAVGDTAAERARATLTKLGLQVKLSLEVEESVPFLRGMWRKKMQIYNSSSWSLYKNGRFSSQKKILAERKNDKELSKILQVPVDEPIKEIKEVLTKQADELEKILLEKISVIENLIESTKKTASMMQHEVANSGNKDNNDVSFIGGRARMSSIDQNLLAQHNVIVGRKKLSSTAKPLIANENLSLKHINIRHRKLSTTDAPFASQNRISSHDANFSHRKISNTDELINVDQNMPLSHKQENHK